MSISAILSSLLKHAPTPGCIRLVDCVALVDENILRTWEFASSPIEEWTSGDSESRLKYSAISYVWRGNPATTPMSKDEIHLVVAGAEEGDPISLSVLRVACTASLRHDKLSYWAIFRRAGFLWLDRLCIVQSSGEDKALQISHMYSIYKYCMQCLIPPGGIGRLVPLEEQTSWASRAWTLQECLAPHRWAVLFEWSAGTGRITENTVFRVLQLDDRLRCGVAKFAHVLRACTDGPMVFNTCSFETPLGEMRKLAIIAAGTTIDIRIFGKGLAHLYTLRSARLTYQNVHGDAARRCYSVIWRCALIRTSSRPVDMIFSIMGLMGVRLNPKSFSANDRLGATIALTRELPARGYSADWLGMPASIPHCPRMSTFPQFPETDVADSAKYLICGKWTPAVTLDDWFLPADNIWAREGKYHYWALERVRGSIGDAGYLNFIRKACVVKNQEEAGPGQDQNQAPAQPSSLLASTDGALHYTENAFGDRVDAFKLMLIEEYGHGKFNVSGYFYVTGENKKPCSPLGISRLDCLVFRLSIF
ncbi:hypothetical protein QBC43DRAFT_351677 [Cladorrhinum sp. PSN259]|nr:hypothetical protein QBC43DRAFT_351677 [Cladorrhinum sp. PSN259]